MKKERKNMFEVMVKKNVMFKPISKNFFLDVPSSDKEVRSVISKKIVDSMSRDMEELANIMTRSILEGFLDGRR